MQLDAGNVGIAGYYMFELNGKRVFEAPCKNLITDFGWNRLLNFTASPTPTSVAQVGTSNTPPLVTDTALGGFVAQVARTTMLGVTGTDGTGSYSATRYTHAFAQGAVVGNIAEVGWKVASGDASLTSRSLVKDGMGNPAVIVVTAIDQLTVLFELRYYRADLDITGSVTIAGTPTTYTLRTSTAVAGNLASGANAALAGMNPVRTSINHYGTGSTLGAPGAAVSGSATTAGLGPVSALSINSSTGVVAFTTHVVATSSGNSAGGILNMDMRIEDGTGGNFFYGAYGIIKVGFSPAIPKNSTKTISYTFSFTFSRL